MKAFLTGLLVACVSSGCAQFGTPSLRPLLGENESLVQYAATLRTRGIAELAEEADNLNKAYAAQRAEDIRLRLAVFHTVVPAPLGDRARALALLDVPPGEVNGRGRQHPLAQMLLPLLQEHRRQEDVQARLREEQKRGDALQQKLDAIRDIERKMLERMPPEKPR